MQDSNSEARCYLFLHDLIRREIFSPDEPDVARISIALGLVEEALTHKSEERLWPNLERDVHEAMQAFNLFIDDQSHRLKNICGTRAKVKAVADAVWSHLTGAFSKDVLHAQHLYNFVKFLGPEGKRKFSKRHLDCAGVTTSVYAACHSLAVHHGHADLGDVFMQISEDHCFLQLDAQGSREGSIEITADNPEKRGLPAQEKLWLGWLYCGGKAVLCSRQAAITAAVVSMNPLVIAGRKREYSEPLRRLQQNLLSLLYCEAPNAMYPAAIAALADLMDADEMDALETAMRSKDVAAVNAALERKAQGAYSLFKEAIESAGGESSMQWYVFSYMAGHLCRRCDVLDNCLELLPQSAEVFRNQAIVDFREAMQWLAMGSRVLTRFSFQPEDEELYKDIFEMIDYCVDGLTRYQKEYLKTDKLIHDASLLEPLLTVWDGVCALFSSRSMPTAWTKLIIKGAKVFSPEAREVAAAGGVWKSLPMQNAQNMWRDLKASSLMPLFELADIGQGQRRNAKRIRVENGE